METDYSPDKHTRAKLWRIDAAKPVKVLTATAFLTVEFVDAEAGEF